MAIVTVTEISSPATELSQNKIELELTSPVVGSALEARAITIAGQIASPKKKIKTIEINGRGIFARVPVTSPAQENLQKIFGYVKGKKSFNVSVGALGLPQKFHLDVSVRFEDDSSSILCKIFATQTPFKSNFVPNINPLMVTSLGRSGSTLMMKLLINHPRIVAMRIHPYEVRVSNYWMRVLKVLGSPRLPGEKLTDDLFGNKSNTIGSNPFTKDQFILGQSLEKWLNNDYLEKLAAFCQSNIEDYYMKVADDQKQEQPKYFSEKIPPSTTQDLLWGLYPQAREIILVRDFRDTVCSILAFDKKRGFSGFGKKADKSDAQFVHELRPRVKQLQQNWLDRKQQAYLVRYEDIVLEPEKTLQGILDYLEIEYTTSDIDKIIAISNESTKELDKHKTSDSIVSSIGRWKQDLSPSLQQICQESFGDVSKYFGYSEK